MPMYQCQSPAGTLADSVRPELVKEITRIHCENTGAPSSFVHVVFQDLTAGAHYTDNKVDLRTSNINCIIRAGRTVATRQQIMKEIAAAWSRLTGQPENQLFRPGGCRPTSDTRAPAVGADQASAAYAGRLVDRFGRPPMLWIMAAITLAGLLLMAAGSVATVIIGLLVTTGGFFAAHSVASGWVSARSARLGVQGSAVYVCCYYLGSGVGGTLGGLAFSAGGWSAVTYYTGAFLLAVLTIAILLRKLRPAAPDGGN